MDKPSRMRYIPIFDSWKDKNGYKPSKHGLCSRFLFRNDMCYIYDFFDLNLKLNYTFVLNDHIKLQLNGGVQNLFNAFQKDLDKGGFRDSGYFYGPTQPRTYFIGVKITN